jgi:hypothetical protein
MAVPFLVFDWLTTSKYQKVGQLFYTDFFSNFTVLTHLRQTTPSPSPQKFGVSWIKWQNASVRIFGERGAKLLLRKTRIYFSRVP